MPSTKMVNLIVVMPVLTVIQKAKVVGILGVVATLRLRYIKVTHLIRKRALR
jgi:hypothetical protein